MRYMQTIEVVLAAGKDREIQRPGRAWMIKSSTQEIDVTEKFNSSEIGKAENVEQGMGLPGAVDDKGFHSLVLRSAIAQTVQIVISDRPMIMQRLSGVVAVVDGGKARTESSRAFLAGMSIGPVSAEFTHVQLWNPAASGKRLFLEQSWVSSNTAVSVTMRRATASLGAANGTVTDKNVKANATSAAETVGITDPSSIGGSEYVNLRLQANENQLIPFTEPLQVDPGFGVFFVAGNANTVLRAYYEFFEEAL